LTYIKQEVEIAGGAVASRRKSAIELRPGPNHRAGGPFGLRGRIEFPIRSRPMNILLCVLVTLSASG
jgi:hypothetical protein